MNFYFDTEFTGLHNGTTLISIGIVSETNETFYAEFTDYDESQCDKWIKDNVLSNLMYPSYETEEGYEDWKSAESSGVAIYGSTKIIKKELIKWLKSFNSPVEFVADVGYYDFMLLTDLLGGALNLPSYVSPVYHDINQDLAFALSCESENEAFDINREDYLEDVWNIKISGKKHTALHDALVLKALCDTALDSYLLK